VISLQRVQRHQLHDRLEVEVSLRVPASKCPNVLVGDEHKGADVVVAMCPSAAAAAFAEPPDDSIALCVAPLHGHRYASAWMDGYFRYYRTLGVRRFFVYAVSTALAATVPRADDVSVLHLAWLHHAGRMHEHGQNWQINDCLHRAARSHRWALSLDFDEFLRLPHTAPPQPAAPPAAAAPAQPPAGGTTAAALRRLVANASAQQVLTFGSVSAADVRANLHRATTTPNCKAAHVDPRRCLGWYGRRKHMVRPARMWAANIHFADRCRLPRARGAATSACAVRHLSTDEAFLLHVHLRNYRSVPDVLLRAISSDSPE